MTQALAASSGRWSRSTAPTTAIATGGEADGDSRRRPSAATRSSSIINSSATTATAGCIFTDNVQTARMPFPEIGFHNTGLYNLDGDGAYPAGGPGI